MKKKDIFKYNIILKPLCEVLTHHSKRKLVGWDESFSKNGYKYPNRHDFYYKCKICGFLYFNNHPTKEDLDFIKRRDNDVSSDNKRGQ